jgi:uncharacterized protein YbbK (DUF523 family)
MATRNSHRDVTAEFIRGAGETAEFAAFYGVKKAYLRRGSPSCGFGETRCRGESVRGNGVTAAKLAAMGIEIITLDGNEE